MKVFLKYFNCFCPYNESLCCLKQHCILSMYAYKKMLFFCLFLSHTEKYHQIFNIFQNIFICIPEESHSGLECHEGEQKMTEFNLYFLALIPCKQVWKASKNYLTILLKFAQLGCTLTPSCTLPAMLRNVSQVLVYNFLPS